MFLVKFQYILVNKEVLLATTRLKLFLGGERDFSLWREAKHATSKSEKTNQTKYRHL